MGKSHDLATLKDDGGQLGASSNDTVFFGTRGTLLSSDTHISHNLYWNGSAWTAINSSEPSSTIRLGSDSGANNEIKFQQSAAGSNNTILTRMTIDASGRVTMPYQPAAFAAKDNGGGFSTVSGIMVFNDVKLNRGNCYNSSTGIFTCPAAGVYRVHAEALTGDVSTSCQVYIHKNGSSVTTFGAHSNYQGDSYYTIGTEALIDCAANDQLSVVMTSGANALYTLADYTKATFMMVG